MNISKRVVLAVIVVNLFLLVILFGVVGSVMTRQFEQIETNNAINNLGRIDDALKAQLTSLSSKNGDWSYWGETFEFAATPNETFIENNQNASALIQLDVSAMLFYSKDGQLIQSKQVNLETEEEIEVSDQLITTVGKSTLLKLVELKENVLGLISSGEEVYLASSRNILTDLGEGPPNGILVFLRLLDESFVAELAETTHLQLDFFTKAKPEADEDFATVISQLDSSSGNHLVRISSNILEGHHLARDINNRSIGYWQFTQERPIYQARAKVITLFLVVFLVTGAAFVILLLLILQKFVLRRLYRISRTVEHIEKTGDMNTSLAVDDGNDEVSALSKAFNGLLERLRRSFTDDKHLQESLATERDTARAIIDTMGEGLLVLDGQFNIIRINKTALKLLETDEANAIGKKWYRLVEAFKDDKKIPLEERSAVKVMESGKPITTKIEDNHYFKTAKGNKFPVVSTTTPYNEKGIGGVVVVFRDVTQERNVVMRIEKEVEERTREAQEARARLISSINSLTIGFVMTDLRQNILLINEAAINTFDQSSGTTEVKPGEIPVVTIDTMAMNLQGKADLVKEIERSLKVKHTVSLTDMVINDKDVELYISPILFDKKAIGVVILVVDVTEEKALNRAKDDFLSIASHELRTPLTAIMGNANLIQEYFIKEIKSADLKEMINDMKTASVRLIDLVNDFLNVSRLEQGRITFKIEPLSLKDSVNVAVNELAATAKPGVKLLVETKNDLEVYADPFRLKEVLINLIGNGLKYTTKGKVSVSWEKKDDKALIRVTDSGVGISRENLNVLFQKFRQAGADNITRDSTKSSGLGLYISRMLVHGMKGDIGLEKSVLGKGSVFYFTLPLQIKEGLNKTSN